MSKKLTYEHIKQYIEERNYQLLSIEYINAKTKLLMSCDKNHVFEMLYHNFYKGHRCPICAHNIRKQKKIKLSYENVKNVIEQEGYYLLSTNYIKSNDKLRIRCNKGHIYEASFKTFNKGHRCKKCSSKTLFYEEVKKMIESIGYKLLSTEYKKANIKLDIQCDKGHLFKMHLSHFKGGCRCPFCRFQMCSSKAEKEIVDYIKNTYNGCIVENDRTQIINPLTNRNLELDIWMPELNKAIEYNGSYWHSLKYAKYKDNIKLKQCKEKGINLLVVDEETWVGNKYVVLENIKNFIFS